MAPLQARVQNPAALCQLRASNLLKPRVLVLPTCLLSLSSTAPRYSSLSVSPLNNPAQLHQHQHQQQPRGAFVLAPALLSPADPRQGLHVVHHIVTLLKWAWVCGYNKARADGHDRGLVPALHLALHLLSRSWRTTAGAFLGLCS